MSSERLTISLPRDPASVPVGRGVLDPLRAELGGRYHDLRLAVSEVLTNAVLHGEGDTIRVVVSVDASRCRVEVIDEGHGFRPEVAGFDPERAGGRGLLLLDAVADDWGVYEGGSTHVWFEARL